MERRTFCGAMVALPRWRLACESGVGVPFVVPLPPSFFFFCRPLLPLASIGVKNIGCVEEALLKSIHPVIADQSMVESRVHNSAREVPDLGGMVVIVR